MSDAARRGAAAPPVGGGVPDHGEDAPDGYLEAVAETLDEWRSKEGKTAWRDL